MRAAGGVDDAAAGDEIGGAVGLFPQIEIIGEDDLQVWFVGGGGKGSARDAEIGDRTANEQDSQRKGNCRHRPKLGRIAAGLEGRLMRELAAIIRHANKLGRLWRRRFGERRRRRWRRSFGLANSRFKPTKRRLIRKVLGRFPFNRWRLSNGCIRHNDWRWRG